MLTVKPYAWKVEEVYDGNSSYTVVDIFAHNKEDSKTVFLRVIDVPIYCYVQVPLLKNGKFIEWEESHAETIFDYLRSKLNDCDGEDFSPTSFELMNKEKLFFSEGVDHYPFIMLSFSSVKHMKRCGYLKKLPLFGGINVEYCENYIPLDTRFQSITKTTHTSWFKFKGRALKGDNLITTCGKQYSVSYKNVHVCSEEESQSWFVNPLIMSWDIETYSDNHRSLPSYGDPNHKLYLISVVTELIGVPGSRKYYVFLYGSCNKPEKDATVFHFKDVAEEGDGELLMIYAFGKFINDIDPDIITGYNINGYDFEYIYRRLEAQGLSWNYCGRYLQPEPEFVGWGTPTIEDGKSLIYSTEGYYKIDTPKYEGKGWQSAGRGVVNRKFYPMPGRNIIDLYPVIKERYALDKYNLDFVSNKYLGVGKNPVTAQEMFQIYEARMRREKGSRADMTRVVDYCIQDSDLVLDLFAKLDIWVDMNEMSNIVGVSIEDTYLRGQQHRCMALLAKALFDAGYVFDVQEGDCEGYAGGSVDEPIPGFYARLLCFDFKSLYPSIIQRYNLCYRSVIPRKYWDCYDIKDCYVCKFEQEEAIDDDEEPAEVNIFTDSKVLRKASKNTHIVQHEYRFLKKRKTILPGIEAGLIFRRRSTIAKAGTFPEYSREQLILNKRQNALKVMANSFYGFLGVQKGKCPCFEIARSVTAYGRMSKKLLGDYIRDTWGGEIVYGDTDSVIPETPIPICQNGIVSYIPIENIYDRVKYLPAIAPGIIDMRGQGFNTWTETGWTPIQYIKKHFVRKELFNVLTTHGHVIVTGDHSLLRSNGTETTARLISPGDMLMHRDVTDITIKQHTESEVFCSAFLTLRCYFAGGFLRASCVGLNSDICLAHVREYLKVTDCGTYIHHNDIVFNKDDWFRRSFMCGTYVKFPDFVYTYSISDCEYFVEAFKIISNKNIASRPILQQSAIYFIHSRVSPISFEYEPEWKISHTAEVPRVISAVSLGVQGAYVYDLETYNSHFGVGPGNLIVHNSCMVRLPQVKENSDCQYWGELIAQVMTGWKIGDPLPGYGYRRKEFPDKVHTTAQKGVFKSPMGIEYEKGMDMLTFCKKYYAYFVINPDGSYKCDKEGNRVIENKGIVTAKRGIEKHLTTYYRKCLYNVLTRHSMKSTMQILSECVTSVIRGEVDNSNLERIATVPTPKKAETHLVKFSKRMALEGVPLVPGDKFSYLVVKGDGKIGDKMRLSERCNEEIDYEHYITNVLAKPLSTLFNVSYYEELEKLHHVTYKPETREHPTGLSKIILTMYRWYRDGHSEKDFFKFVKEDSKMSRPCITVVNDPWEALKIAMAMEKKKNTASRKKSGKAYAPLYIDNGPYTEKRKPRAPPIIGQHDMD